MKERSGLATAGFVLGVIAIVLSFIPIINNIAFILAIIGLVFALVGMAKSSKKGFGITGTILCILSIVITLAMQSAASKALDDLSNNLDGTNTSEILENSADVQLGTFTVETGDYGIQNTSLPVTVTNKTNENKTFSITIEAVDANGTRLETGYVYANDLGANQMGSYETFTYVSSDKIDALTNATFKVAEISMY